MNERASTRRLFLKSLGATVGALALVHCSGGSDDDASGTGSSGGTSSGTSGTSGTADAGAFDSGDGSVATGSLAVGSGAFLDGKDYGNPFASGVGTTCAVFESATKGPCHSNTYNRKDVSDGLVGLPTRMEFLIVDASCNPVPNAIVEIWYASPIGTYSRAAQAIDDGSDYEGSASDLNVGFCTGNDSEALASSWLRGFQTSDASGRVTIDGIFPGWYAGRAPHIHFVVTAAGHSTLTSQVLFDEALTTAVYTGHGSYSARGDKDTTNASDNVGLGDAAVMGYAQQADGALVVWKAITVA